MVSRVKELEAAIQRIVDAWEGGDLAGAVNDAAGLLPDSEDDSPLALYSGSITAGLNDECLVTIWQDGSCEVAFRSGLESWGPPESLEARETR